MPNEGRFKIGSNFLKIGSDYLRIGSVSNVPLLLGNFYADADSFSLCSNDAALTSNVALADFLNYVSYGPAGAGFVVFLLGGAIRVYNSAGTLTAAFDMDDGGFPLAGAPYGSASSTHVYVTAVGDDIKRYLPDGTFVNDRSANGPLILGVIDEDSIWAMDDGGGGTTTFTKYTALVSISDFVIDFDDLACSQPGDADLSGGYIYGLCTRNDAAGWRVVKVDLAGESGATLVAGSDTSYIGLAVGGGRLYLQFAGASPGAGFVEIRNLSDGSLISTVMQSGGTDTTFGIARQKV